MVVNPKIIIDQLTARDRATLSRLEAKIDAVAIEKFDGDTIRINIGSKPKNKIIRRLQEAYSAAGWTGVSVSGYYSNEHYIQLNYDPSSEPDFHKEKYGYSQREDQQSENSQRDMAVVNNR